MGWGVVGPLTQWTETTTTGDLVYDRFIQARNFAGEAWDNAVTLLQSLEDLDYIVDWEAVAITDIPLMGLDGLGMEEPTVPPIEPVSIREVDFTKSDPELEEPDITTEPVPVFDVAPVDFQIPPVPTVEWPIFTGTEPAVSEVDLPPKPEYVVPVVPELDAISIPSPPDYSLLEFEGTAPVIDLTPPEPMYVYNEAEYSSALRTALAAKLATDITEGGSGLDADTEQAIYDRATARQELENQQMYDEALNYWSSRGFTLPPGALSGKLLEVNYKITQGREDLNNDILVQQSNLAQKNTHFIIERAIQSEKDLMDYTNQFQQRAFESAKYVVESALTIYGIKVEGYKAELAAYQALAEVFVAKIRGEMARAELYKARIDGVKAGVDAQKVLIEAYRAQLAGIQTTVDLYRTEMEAADVKIKVDQAKIENFKALVDVYATRIQAVTARYAGYQAQIAGESEKAKMYASQVDAYKSRVDAYKSKADVDIARAQTAVELNRGRIDSYLAAIDKYKAEVTAAIAVAETMMKGQELDVGVFEAEVRKYDAEVEATVRTYLGRVEEAKANLQLQIRESEVAVNVTLAKYGLTTESIRSAADVSAQLAASALSSVSASAAVGFSENRADTTSYTASKSRSYTKTEQIGTNISEQHNYHYTRD